MPVQAGLAGFQRRQADDDRGISCLETYVILVYRALLAVRYYVPLMYCVIFTCSVHQSLYGARPWTESDLAVAALTDEQLRVGPKGSPILLSRKGPDGNVTAGTIHAVNERRSHNNGAQSRR
jgi:hypothetical protein